MGVSTCTSHGQKYLLGLHESPHLEHNKHSLVSTGQSREHGVWIGDVLRRHGGDQRIVAKAEDGTAFDYDLGVENGLMDIKLTYPTDDEMETLPTVWLTSDQPWDPRVLDDEDATVLPWWTPADGGDFLRQLNHARLEEVDAFAKNMAQQSGTLKYLHGNFHWNCMDWDTRGRLPEYSCPHPQSRLC